MKGTNAIEEWNNGGVEAVGGSKKQLKWAKLPKESGSFKTTDGSHWIRHFVKYDASSKCDWSVYIRPWRHVHDNELSFRYPTWKVTYSSFNVQDDKQTTWAVKRILREKQAESKSPTSGTMTLQQLSKRQTSNSSLAQKIQNDTNTVLSSQQNSLSNALLLPCARNQLAMGVGPPQRERCPNFWHDSARLNPKLGIKRTMLCQSPQKTKRQITKPVDNLYLCENLTLEELHQKRNIELKDLVQKVHHWNLETCECISSTILQFQRPGW